MIQVVEFNDQPMSDRERRELVLAGSRSFTIQIKCFVDDPPGFRDCPACTKEHIIRAREPLFISPGAAFADGRRGSILIAIRSAEGETLDLTIHVNERHGSTQGGMMAGA